MNTIHVTASRDYDVLIGSGILARLGQLSLSLKKPCKVAVITDSHLEHLYAKQVCDNLLSSGFAPVTYSFPAGEAQKNPETYFQILNFLASQKLTRSDLIIALGGGVTGDMAGFAAATYLRGIDFIQIPTSLLAMVDSSVGGKTAIDLPAGKNLVGAFYQPILVLCDIDLLSTLPANYFQDGCAEVIKYGVLYDEALFDHLSRHGLHFDREYVISRCVELKRDVVAQDEFDNGARQKLNLGHTIGHGIEAQSNFSVTHGHAVAAGMAMITKAAVQQGICQRQVYNAIVSCLQKFGLPIGTGYDAASIYTSALSDKKRSGGNINLILPEKIGYCRRETIPVEQLLTYIEAGLA